MFDTSGVDLEVADLAISGAAMRLAVEIALVQPGDLPGLLPLISGRI